MEIQPSFSYSIRRNLKIPLGANAMGVQIDIHEAVRLYRDEGLPSTKVSKIVGCSVQTLINRLRRHGVEIRKNGYDKEKLSFETMKREYESGMSCPQIAKKHKMSQVSIWNRLKRGGVQMRDRKEEARKACTKIQIYEHTKIIQRYKNEPVTCSDIARDYKVHKSTIADILKKHGIKPDEIQGRRHHNWKGGITPLHSQIRNCEKAQQWKRACMERVDYTCQITGERGGKLHVHHKMLFSTILKQFLSSGGSTLEEALEYKPFWDINNGITITEKQHNKTHGINAKEEERPPKAPKKEIDMDLAMWLYSEGQTATAVAKIVGCSTSVLLERLREADVDIRHFSTYKKGCCEIESLVQQYLSGSTTKELSQKYSVSQNAISKRLKKHGVQMRSCWEERKKIQ